MKRLAITIAAITLTTSLSAENIFRSLVNSLSNPSNDLSKKHSQLARVDAGPFFFYKLRSGNNHIQTSAETSIEQTTHKLMTESEKETARIALEKHLNDDVSDKPYDQLHDDEKDVLYGDSSPMRDDAVILAWQRAREAENRLKRHREYMKRVNKARESISKVKESDPRLSQTDASK